MQTINLPEEFVIFDMEWTAWEGSMQRGWSESWEQREIYDIGAVLVRRAEDGTFEVVDTFRQLVTLELTDQLPEYSTNLTGITQQDIDEQGVLFRDMVAAFQTFVGKRPIYSWGLKGTHDGEKLVENCELKNVENPFPPDQFHNLVDVFKECGVPAEDYMSSTIVEYFGETNQHTEHQGLDDALNQMEALNLLQEKLRSESGPTMS